MNEPTKQEMDTFISELKVTRPRYLKRAKRRADKFNKKGWNVACPKCGEDQMDILHVFPDPNTWRKRPKIGMLNASAVTWDSLLL